MISHDCYSAEFVDGEFATCIGVVAFAIPVVL